MCKLPANIEKLEDKCAGGMDKGDTHLGYRSSIKHLKTFPADEGWPSNTNIFEMLISMQNHQ